MEINTLRFKLAFRAMVIHFGLSLLVAAVIAWLVFTLWFPYPYRELAGGSELFMLVIAVDLVCGPLLTFVLYSPTKPRREMLTDVSLVIVIQLAALVYGISTVWQVRPLFVVQEADRLTLISRANLALHELDALPSDLKPSFFREPVQVSLRELNVIETEKLNAEIKTGGHDAVEHPLLYVKYDSIKAYKQANPIRNLLISQPKKKDQIDSIAITSGIKDINQLRYMYIFGRHAWLVILNSNGEFLGFVESI